MNYSTDHGSSYADRQRNSPSILHYYYYSIVQYFRGFSGACCVHFMIREPETSITLKSLELRQQIHRNVFNCSLTDMLLCPTRILSSLSLSLHRAFRRVIQLAHQLMHIHKLFTLKHLKSLQHALILRSSSGSYTVPR